jgi:hypothetical protein
MHYSQSIHCLNTMHTLYPSIQIPCTPPLTIQSYALPTFIQQSKSHALPHSPFNLMHYPHSSYNLNPMHSPTHHSILCTTHALSYYPIPCTPPLTIQSYCMHYSHYILLYKSFVLPHSSFNLMHSTHSILLSNPMYSPTHHSILCIHHTQS